MDKTFGVRDPRLDYFTRPGAYLIQINNGRLACVRTPKGHFLLGGGLEGQESHADCIRRECLEEAGLAVTVGPYLCCAETYCMHHRIGPFHPVQYYYACEIQGRVTAPIEPDHTFTWLPLGELEQRMYVPQQIWAVQHSLRLRKEV